MSLPYQLLLQSVPPSEPFTCVAAEQELAYRLVLGRHRSTTLVPILITVAKPEFSELLSFAPDPCRPRHELKEECPENLTPANMTAGIPRRRSIMNSAMDRLRHRLFQGNTFAAREMERCTSLISCSRVHDALNSRHSNEHARNLSMCLKAIAFTHILESDNKMLASQRKFFSRLVRDQNLVQPAHLSPATDPRRAEPRGRIKSAPRTRMNQYYSSR